MTKVVRRSANRGLLVSAIIMIALALAVMTGCSGASVKSSFSDYSWSELAKISAEISAADSDLDGMEIAQSYHLVSSSGKLDMSKTKSVQLSDGTSAKVTIAGFRQDTKSDGKKAGISFVFTDVVATEGMNHSATNTGGWEKSEMREWLNADFIGMLPSDLKSSIATVKKSTNCGNDGSPGAVVSTNDKVWLLSVSEVSGDLSASSMPAHGKYSPDNFNAEGKQYQVFKDSSVKGGESDSKLERKCVVDTESGIVKKDELSPWWLRSLSMDWTAGFSAVADDGSPYGSWFPDYELGVCPGFSI